jgi:hypothetical protein
MAIANITGNILTDSGVSTSSLLPLSGGTITGFLTSSKSITTGENGQISIIPSTNTSAAFLQVTNTDGTTYFGKNNNSGSYLSSSPNATLVYSTGSSPIMLYTNGNMIMTLTGGTPSVGGNVLINTTSDNGAKLQVSGTATFSSSVTAAGATFSGTTAVASVGGTSQMRIDRSGAIARIQNYDSGSAANISLAYDGGNIGIGTSSPTEILHLNSSNTAAFIRFQNTGGGGTYLGSRNANMEIYTGDSEKMRITSSGNVLINTTSSTGAINIDSNRSNLVLGAVTSSKISFNNNSTTERGYIYNDATELAIGFPSVFNIQRVGVGNLVTVTSSGNVGIGTSSPTNYGSTNTTLSVNNFNSGGGGVFEAMSNGNSAIRMACSPSDCAIWEPRNVDMLFATNNTPRMRITSAGVINTTSRLNVNGAGDNSLFSFINNGTTYTLGFSPNASASTSNSLTITTTTTTWIYNGTGTATWTLPTPSGTNQMFWIRNAGTGTLTLNAFSGTSIVNTANSLVSSITIAVGATALIQQDGNIRSYQLQ